MNHQEAVHTQTPWEIGYGNGVTGNGATFHRWDESLEKPCILGLTDEPKPIILISAGDLVIAHVIPQPCIYKPTNGNANAEFIVRACNAHSGLVAALEAAIVGIEEVRCLDCGDAISSPADNALTIIEVKLKAALKLAREGR